MGLRDTMYRAQDALAVFFHKANSTDEEEYEEDGEEYTQPQRTIQRVQPDEYDEEEEVVGEPVDDEVDELLQEEIHQSAGLHDRIVNWCVWAAAVLGTPVLWFILGLGNAQLYADFRPLSFDPLVILAYVAGFSFEFFGIVMILMAGRYAAKKEWVRMAGVLFFAVFVALSTFFAQYVLLQSEYANHLLSFSDTVLAGLPINNHNGIFFVRALTPTVLEFAIVFIFAERNPSAVETLRRKRKIQAELNEYKRGHASMKRENVFNDVFVKFEEGFAKDFEYKMGMFAQHGMIVQEHTPIMIEKHTTERIPEQAQSKQFVQQTQSKQFVQPNPNTLTQRVVPKRQDEETKQEVKKSPVQQPVTRNVSLEGDEEELPVPQKPPLPSVQPQQVAPKPPPRPFVKTGSDITQQQTGRLDDTRTDLASIRKLLEAKNE